MRFDPDDCHVMLKYLSFPLPVRQSSALSSVYMQVARRDAGSELIKAVTCGILRRIPEQGRLQGTVSFYCFYFKSDISIGRSRFCKPRIVSGCSNTENVGSNPAQGMVCLSSLFSALLCDYISYDSLSLFPESPTSYLVNNSQKYLSTIHESQA